MTGEEGALASDVLLSVRNVGCRLTVYDGMYGTMTWNRTGDYCRRSQRATLFSSGQYMRIVFTTDSSRSRRGFSLSLQSTCGGHVSGARGELTSPGYPAHYPAHAACEWVVATRPATSIAFSFLDLDIAGGGAECAEDSLVLRNGARGTSPFLLLNPAQGDNQVPGRCLTALISPRLTLTLSERAPVRPPDAGAHQHLQQQSPGQVHLGWRGLRRGLPAALLGAHQRVRRLDPAKPGRARGRRPVARLPERAAHADGVYLGCGGAARGEDPHGHRQHRREAVTRVRSRASNTLAKI